MLICMETSLHVPQIKFLNYEFFTQLSCFMFTPLTVVFYSATALPTYLYTMMLILTVDLCGFASVCDLQYGHLQKDRMKIMKRRIITLLFCCNVFG